MKTVCKLRNTMPKGIVSLILTILLCVTLSTTVFANVTSGNGQGQNNDDSINVYSSDGKIIVEVDNDNDCEIWANNGDEWFLIKDKNETKVSGDEVEVENFQNIIKYSWKWNLVINSDLNQQELREVSIREDEYKVYIKAGDETLYKTFYLSDILQDKNLREVNMVTSFDFNDESEQGNLIDENDDPLNYIFNEKMSRTQFPAYTQSENKFYVKIFYQNPGQEYYLGFAGDDITYSLDVDRNLNNSNKIFQNSELVKINSHPSGFISKLYKLEFKKEGIFNLKVYRKSDDKEALNRKIYVYDINKTNYDISNITTKDNNQNTIIKMDVQNGSGNQGRRTKFVVGEPNVWSKTIKDYKDDKDNGGVQISTNGKKIEFGTGNYFIAGYVKGEHSVEWEDGRSIEYSRKKEDISVNINLKLTHKYDKTIKEKQPYGKYAFTVNGQEEITGVEYAFLIFDDKGKRVIRDYNTKKTFDWYPVDPGKYTIYARVRYKSEHGDERIGGVLQLENSLEKEVSDKFEITDDRVGTINIQSVNLNGEQITDSNEARVYKPNYIQVNVQQNDNIENRLMYKVYAINEGIWQTLTNYTYENEIPFVPKDTGTYKILVLVKDSLSGAEEAREEFTVEVK